MEVAAARSKEGTRRARTGCRPTAPTTACPLRLVHTALQRSGLSLTDLEGLQTGQLIC